MFPDETALLGNMIGLLGNIVEVPELRPKLMTEEFVEEVSDLLDCDKDGSELSSTAAGVLAHLASDGAQAWTVSKPGREEVLCRMSRAITRWDIMSKRNIHYRSFAPMISLARVSHTAQCQLWAVWALANLTSVTPSYCRLLLQEGGLAVIEGILSDQHLGGSTTKLREWAGVVKVNVIIWQESGTEM